jgi:acyl-CoA thioesterase
MGMEVIEAGEGHSRLKLPVKKEFRNVYGATHGGAIATLLDSCCSIAAGTLLEPREAAVTLNQRINYISNPREGILYAEGRAVHKGRNTGVGLAEVRDDKGNLVAVGIATIFIFKR